MSIQLDSLKIKIIDSYNFLPMSLSRLPKTFGQTELAKGFFSHFFNIRENQAYVGVLPDAKFYGPDAMSAAQRQSFFEWYERRKLENFDFQKEMLEYCR